MPRPRKTPATVPTAPSTSTPLYGGLKPRVLSATTVKVEHFDSFIETLPLESKYVAVSAAYGSLRKLEWLVFLHAGAGMIPLLIRMNSAERLRLMLVKFLDTLVTGRGARFIAYSGDLLAAGLFLEYGIRLKYCHNIHTLSPAAPHTTLIYTQEMFGKHGHAFTKDHYRALFNDSSRSEGREMALLCRALGALLLAGQETKTLQGHTCIDTEKLSDEVLQLAAKALRNLDCREALKPMQQKHDFASATIGRKGNLEVVGSRFKTRVRLHGGDQISRINFGENKFVMGSTKSVKGKTGVFKLMGSVKTKVKSITTIGKDPPTSNEVQVVALVNRVLCGKGVLFSENKIITLVLLSRLPLAPRRSALAPLSSKVTKKLNPAQSRAVRAFCSPHKDKNPLIQLVHGPPGTGKTTLISSAVQWLAGSREAIYIVTQSNVAIKNVAESLAKLRFMDFRLIVSEDFYFEWHEHLYEGISDRLIRSSELPEHAHDVHQLLGGARVILCTLSMLANTKLAECGLTSQLLPPTTLIIDEASQIPACDYLPSFERFVKTIRRACFVGDHKQLAPFGQSDIPSLHSVFDFEHFVKNAYFLDTQYRMPHVVGRFISKHVYDDKLMTVHDVKSPRCLRFVDVQGVEAKQGRSSVNEKEARCCIRLARQLEGQQFRILTGYDAQRQRIENMLKAENLPWEDKVFNVDSFQGNEADFIIVSLVRTVSPGFLTDERRTNVMLSRCKKGMVVLANRTFLLEHTRARETLVAKMAEEMTEPWLTDRDIMNGRRVFD